jgi:serine protease Do
MLETDETISGGSAAGPQRRPKEGKRQEEHMRHDPEYPSRGTSVAVQNATLVAAIGLAALIVLYFVHSGRNQIATAARPGLDGPEIQMLEKQNQAYQRIIQASIPAIVYIRTEQVIKAEQSPMFLDPTFRQFFGDILPQIPKDQKQHALGTGVLFEPNGYVVTNNHVIDHASTVEVMLTDKRMFKAKVIGTDPDIDIAVVKIEAKALPTMPLGDSLNVHVGDTVMAFGNPFGLNFTVTRGTVSALGRSQFNIEPVQDFIQTDAAINPGNSGGALVDVRGQVVGINTAILSPGVGMGGEGGSVGIGFAIPINMAKRTMEALIKNGKVSRGYLGVSIGPVTPELAQEFKVPDTSGALIQDVTRSGPADKAGLKPGDVIRKVDGRTVSDSSDLLAVVANTNPGTPVTLEVLRNGQPLTVKVPLDPRPAELGYTASSKRPPSEGSLRGIAVQNLTPAIRQQLGLPADARGVVVTSVDPGSPAAQYLEQGDLIMSVNRHDVNSVADFNKLAAEAKGRTLLRIMHGGQASFVVISPDRGDSQ